MTNEPQSQAMAMEAVMGDMVVDMVVAMGDMVMGEVLEVDLEVEKEDMGGVLEVALEAEQDMVALGVDMGDMIMAKEV